VNSDQQISGLEANVVIDRDTAARLGITAQQIDAVLYDAFGQEQISTIYQTLNQYHVVMEVDPKYQLTPDALKSVYVIIRLRGAGAAVGVRPLCSGEYLAVGQSPGTIPLRNHLVQPCPGVDLGTATRAIDNAELAMRMPLSIHGSFQGTAAAFQDSLSSEPMLILTALLAVYIVLGMLYESYIHPITILSTLPSAGTGALLALLLFHMQLDVIGLIGIILLIGIVKKNAIMMIDFALEVERTGKTAEEAIYEAGLVRFRPIMMTTMAAMLGALPLALGTGVGSEIRRPLGVAIVGGLIVSQAYVYLDRLRLAFRGGEAHSLPQPPAPTPSPAH
jgi:multidrug efflux pump